MSVRFAAAGRAGREQRCCAEGSMNIDLCHIFCFSPTGSTLRVAEAIAVGTGLPFRISDVTLPEQRALETAFVPNSLIVLAVPVYFGRVEKHAAGAVAALRGRGQPAVLVVNYGNRHYDDALLELHTLSKKAGFMPMAAGAFVSEHSFSTPEYPLAQGRPDRRDLERANLFGTEIMNRLADGPVPLPLPPGKRPYKDYPELHRAPVQHQEACSLCGLCEALCPVAAITIRDGLVITDEDICMVCQACVKGCPEGARTDTAPGGKETKERLIPLVKERREPEVFI